MLRAIDAPTIDHRGPGFAELGRELLDGIAEVLRTDGPVVIYPSSGTGAWEAALVNTLSPGDRRGGRRFAGRGYTAELARM